MRKGKKLIGWLLSSALFVGMLMPVHATTIEDAKKKADQLEEQKKAAEGEKASLATQLNTIIGEMQTTQSNITKKVDEIEKTENELIQAKVEESIQYESMKLRIKYMYENGNSEFITLMLEAKTIADLLNKAEYVSQISDYDRQMLVEFQKVVKQVEDKEAQLKKEHEALEVLQNSLVEKQSQVQTLLEQKNMQISSLNTEIGDNAKVLQDLIAKAAEAERVRKEAAEAAAAAAAAAKNNNSASGSTGSSGSGSYQPGGGGPNNVVGTGQFTHPCPGSYLSSGYGFRSFDNSFHRGYDYANHGVSLPTYAAAAGKVIIANFSASAGNWVVIQHDNGLVTKYMHHSKLYVSAGQRVEKGQNLGMTGNTGYSSGIHLHFQVEKDGKAVDPGLYL